MPFIFILWVLFACLLPAAANAQSQPELRWGGDAEGGAPYVEANPDDLTHVVGFDVEVAQLLASGLGRAPRFIQVGFTSLDAAAARGDFDVGLSGVEDSPARRSRLAVTIPYYEFREVMTIRAADRDRFRSLSDLRGRRVATLGATLAYDLLVDSQPRDGIVPITYEDDVHPYSDLVLGRVDAVVLDFILAQRGVRRNPGLVNQPAPLAVGHYVGVLAPNQTALRDRMNAILRAAMRDGRLEAIFRRWSVWNEDQPRLYARLLADASANPIAPSSLAPANEQGDAARTLSGPRAWEAARRYLPALLNAAVITVLLSCLSMALAVGVGVLIASGRIYGSGPLRLALTTYVEIIRGTPLLLQLFVLYFGLAAFIQLPAFLAALLGLGLNYAAYESEIYRGALEAVPSGQLDAARTLGFNERQILVLVRAPQAFRLALAPMTNDFVALLKDSSLVSVITVVELTKETSIFAANIGSWVLPGAMCAAMYLALSLPLASVARRIERGMEPVMTVLDVHALEVRRGGRAIVSGISFSASGSEVVTLMGASGAGKTTILRAIAGLDRLTAGTVTIPRPVGMVFQFHHLFANMTALKNVWLAPVHVFKRARAEAEAQAQELLVSLGVGERAGAMPGELSGGEAQRVAIARALAIEPPVLLMDEPTASLDPARRGELAATLRLLAAQGRTIVVATHDAEFARACAHRVLMIEDGRIRHVS